MGLIKAAMAGVKSNLADQWKEFIYADSLEDGVLVVRGKKKTNNTNFQSSNTKGSEDVISNGSTLVCADGQAMIVTVEGEIVDFTCEPGEYTFDKGTEPSLLCGSFGEGLKNTFKNIGKRFTYGGDVAAVHRVYYVNTKELMGNKFGSSSPVPYDDPYYKTVLYIRYFGTYSLRIADPLLFYKSVAGNVTDKYVMSSLMEQCNNEFYTALDSALGAVALEGVKFSLLPTKQKELANYMNEVLDDEWVKRRGLIVEAVGINKVTPDDTSRKRIEEFDNATMLGGNAAAMQGRMVGAQAKAFENMGNNQNGASGMDMAGMAFGMNMMNQMMNNQQGAPQGAPQGTGVPQGAPQGNAWTCTCGAQNTGKFCMNCGSAKPVANSGGTWQCSCGTQNTGKFCMNCGSAKPANVGWTCPNCGRTNTGNFCNECGTQKP